MSNPFKNQSSPLPKNGHKTLKLGFLENSHRFLREAANKAQQAKEQPEEWVFATASLVQSVELALKAALFKIHPILIFENIDNPKRTVSIGVAANRLSNDRIGNIDFTSKDKKRLKRAIIVRNEITHSDFSVNIAMLEANFHEVFAFLAEFNRRTFSVNIDEIIDGEMLVDFLQNHKHHEEMLSRALIRIDDEDIDPSMIRSCAYCGENTLIEGEDAEATCYLCHNLEKLIECNHCGEIFIDNEIEDFSEAFDSDYTEGQLIIHNNYGYDYHTACECCVSEIKQKIHDEREHDYYMQMMESEYMDRHRGK